MQPQVFLLVLLALFVCSAKGYEKKDEKSCRYWCRTSHHQYFCCSSEKSETWMHNSWRFVWIPWFWFSIGTPQPAVPPMHSTWPEIFPTKDKHKKHCPTLRSHCRRSYEWHSAPTFCEHDEDCDHWNKCCYDVCLEHKTCKPAE